MNEEEPMEEDSMMNEDGDDADGTMDGGDEEIAEGGVKTKRGKRGKKGKGKKKSEVPDVSIATSAEMASALGMEDVSVEPTEEDYTTISSLKAFINRFRPEVLAANPKCNVSKAYPLMQVKYREFNDYLIAQGRTPPPRKTPKTRGDKSASLMPVSGQDKTVAPLRIRISTRKSNKKRTDDDDGDSRDSDAEFEKLLVQQETFLDEADHEKEEKRMSRAAARADKKKVALEQARKVKKLKKDT